MSDIELTQDIVLYMPYKCLLCTEPATNKAYNKHIPTDVKGWKNRAYFCDKCKRRKDIKRNWIFEECLTCKNYGKTVICWDCKNGNMFEK